ncbi:hypothetical protein DdX_05801 [Ditylenchus destructor]|uniref:Uncharacterized protein n=1 Tax=Ditylenchus destructor TaxID=166010 RepID=A0AAD4N9U6_9BILA|nr:hypothetical protein DdX_05801 [Ditylenchus destructor]
MSCPKNSGLPKKGGLAPRWLDCLCPRNAGLLKKAGLAPRWLDWPPRTLDYPQDGWTAPKRWTGPRVGAAEGRDGRPHPNAGLPSSKNSRLA